MTFGLYIHFPFCLAKCGYCDFASCAVDPQHIPHEAYADAVLRELAWRAADYGDLTLRSIYIGGGTPSLWEPREVARVVRAARTAWRAADEGLEVTLEVNPATVEASGLGSLRDAGVSRLSVGVQSLSDETLRLLGRIHDAEEARRCVRAARDVVDSVSCDAIFGVPHQTVADHLATLRQLVELGPQHVSTYALSLSADAPLRRAGLAPAADELLAEMMDAGREVLEAAGLPQYEVSSFAPPRWRSKHNVLVWAGHPYLGLGAAAHSMIRRGPTTLRIANPPAAAYMAGELERQPAAGIPTVAGATIEMVGEPRSRHEALFLALRTVDGLDRGAYRERFGGDPCDHFAAITALAAADLVSVDEARIAPTRRGIWLADEIVLRLMG